VPRTLYGPRHVWLQRHVTALHLVSQCVACVWTHICTAEQKGAGWLVEATGSSGTPRFRSGRIGSRYLLADTYRAGLLRLAAVRPLLFLFNNAYICLMRNGLGLNPDFSERNARCFEVHMSDACTVLTLWDSTELTLNFLCDTLCIFCFLA
jgi:hypothetical protein